MKLNRRAFIGTGAAAATLLSAPHVRAAGGGAGKVIVIGGGAGGATAARYLARDSKGEIDVTLIEHTGRVIFGATVHLVNLDTDEEISYQIVGDDEADLKISKISVYSPIARALVGKQVGDVALVHAPNGTIEYEICLVEHL